jgi:hypothetical protein
VYATRGIVGDDGEFDDDFNIDDYEWDE